MLRNRVVAVALATLAASFPVIAQQPAKLRFSSVEPPFAPITSRVLIPWAKEVSAASQGTLEIEMFAGGTLGRSITQQVKLVQDGVADITWTAPAMTPGRFGGVEVSELQFVIRNAREGGLAIWRLYEQGLFTGFDEFKVLLLGATSPQFINARTPIRTLEEFRGKRLAIRGPVRVAAVQKLGGAPVQTPPPQVADALSKGVVDAVLGEWNFIVTFKLDEVATHFHELPLGSDVLMVIMLKSKYDALPAPARAAIDRHSGEPLVRQLIALFESSDAEARERVSKQARATVLVPTDADVARWRVVTDPVVQAWRRESAGNERLYQALDGELAKIRAAK